jgi:hypothetical protein
VWPDVCSLQHEIRLLVPGSRVECVDFQGMDLGLQMQMASEATLHITPHGGLAYSLLFSRPGSASIVLVDNSDTRKAKDVYILPNLPWLHVMYLHRGEEHLMHIYIKQAIVQASIRLGIPLPAFDLDAGEAFLRRRLASRIAAEEEAKHAQMARVREELLLMEAAASQLAVDVEQSRGVHVSLVSDDNGRSSSGVQILANMDTACSVFSNTRMLCWGWGVSTSEDDSTIPSSRPVPIRTRGVFIGKMHLTLAFPHGSQSDGRVFLCGHHVDSLDVSIIDREGHHRIMCVPVESKSAEGHEIGEPHLHSLAHEHTAGIAIGPDGLTFACVIMRASGELQCTGSNHVGQLGDGSLVQRSWFCPPRDMDACRVSLPLPAISVSVGSSHACAVVRQGAVYVDLKQLQPTHLTHVQLLLGLKRWRAAGRRFKYKQQQPSIVPVPACSCKRYGCGGVERNGVY